MSGPTLKLGTPIERLGAVTDSLQFPELMRAKHLAGVDVRKLGEADQIARVIVNLTGEAEAVIAELEVGDFLAASEVVNGFFSARGGPKSDPPS